MSVAQGVGRAVVTATGMSTQMGQIAGPLHATHEDPTPLQQEIAGVSRMLGRAVIVIAVVVVATVFTFFGMDTLDDVVTTLLLGVSLAVAAVPEGAPPHSRRGIPYGIMSSRRGGVQKLQPP